MEAVTNTLRYPNLNIPASQEAEDTITYNYETLERSIIFGDEDDVPMGDKPVLSPSPIIPTPVLKALNPDPILADAPITRTILTTPKWPGQPIIASKLSIPAGHNAHHRKRPAEDGEVRAHKFTANGITVTVSQPGGDKSITSHTPSQPTTTHLTTTHLTPTQHNPTPVTPTPHNPTPQTSLRGEDTPQGPVPQGPIHYVNPTSYSNLTMTLVPQPPVMPTPVKQSVFLPSVKEPFAEYNKVLSELVQCYGDINKARHVNTMCFAEIYDLFYKYGTCCTKLRDTLYTKAGKDYAKRPQPKKRGLLANTKLIIRKTFQELTEYNLKVLELITEKIMVRGGQTDLNIYDHEWIAHKFVQLTKKSTGAVHFHQAISHLDTHVRN